MGVNFCDININELNFHDDLNLLEELLHIYSPSGEEEQAAAFLTKQMQQRGFETAIDAVGNVTGWRGAGPHEILLLGHIDTVPGFIPVRREEDSLFGRGAVDAKGPLACFVCAAASVAVPPGWRITVTGAVGEEGDSRGAYHLLQTYSRGAPPQTLVIGEPSGWERITLGFKGSTWFNYRVQRSLAHTAGKQESACEAAVRYWNTVVAWCQSQNNASPTTPFTQLTPTLRAMHSTADGFLETAHVRIGIRLPPGIEPADVQQALEQLKEDGELTAESAIPAYKAEKNTPLVRSFLGAVRRAAGKPVFTFKTGTADMNIVAPVWKCPVVAYGPGDSNLDHTPNEHILVSEYLKSIQVLRDVLQSEIGL